MLPTPRCPALLVPPFPVSVILPVFTAAALPLRSCPAYSSLSVISVILPVFTGRSVFDLSVCGPPPAPSEGPGPLFRKQKQRAAGAIS